MPRQFYLTADPPPFTPANWRGDWNDTTQAITMRLDSTKTTADPTKYKIQIVQANETSSNSLWRVALARFVGGPLKAQTVGGCTMQLMAGVWASAVTAEFYYALHAYVTVGDTDDVRGTLIGISMPEELNVVTEDFAEQVSSQNPFPITPKGRDLIYSAGCNAVVVEDLDRLVVEIGLIARNTLTTQLTGAFYYGTDYYSNGSPDVQRDP